MYFFPVYIFFKDNSFVEYAISPTWQNINFNFAPLGLSIAQDRYFYTRQFVRYNYDRSKKFSLSGKFEWGDFYNGKRETLTSGVRYAPIPHFSVSIDYEYNHLKNIGLKEQNLEIPIVAALDGDHALQLLRDWAEPCPTIPHIHIIIDTKTPGDAGHRFLEEIRRDPVLQPALVFVLSTAKSSYNANAAYDMNVAAVIAKDDTHVDLSNVIKLIGLYSKTITFPGQHDSIR